MGFSGNNYARGTEEEFDFDDVLGLEEVNELSILKNTQFYNLCFKQKLFVTIYVSFHACDVWYITLVRDHTNQLLGVNL